MKQLFFIFLIFTCASSQIKVWDAAHAHNDYENKRPLIDALENGFTSIEVDVHLKKGQLFISHNTPIRLDTSKTLASLYLSPLSHHIKNNNGEIYKGYKGKFYLMLDIKTDATQTFKAIEKEMLRFPLILEKTQVFISGNRNYQQIIESKLSIGVDGRLSDLGQGYNSKYMPVVSANYKGLFKWNGKKSMPSTELRELKVWVQKAHKENKQIRFWGIPDNPNGWEMLLNAGVDLINTDKVQDFNNYMLTNQK